MCVDEATSVLIESYVCAMYGKSTYQDINKLRCDLFRSRYDVKSGKSGKFVVPNGMDLSLLPPCRDALSMHTLRASYVAYTWKHAHIQYPEILNPTKFGWTSDNGVDLKVQWNKCDLMPQELIDVLEEPIDTDAGPSTAAVETEQETEQQIEVYEDLDEDYEIDNIVDIIFEDDED